MFMDLDSVEVRKLAKKEQGQYPATLIEQAWPIKDLLLNKCGSQRDFCYGIWPVVLSGLARSGSQS